MIDGPAALAEVLSLTGADPNNPAAVRRVQKRVVMRFHPELPLTKELAVMVRGRVELIDGPAALADILRSSRREDRAQCGGARVAGRMV